MTQPDHSLLVKGYCMTLLGGLLWSVGGACGQVMFRSCGVTSNWLVPIRLFIGGLITLAVAAIVGNKPLEVLRHKEAWPSLLVFSLLGSALCQYSYYSSVQYANVAFATVISYCSPVVILLWTAIATRKKPRPYELCSVALVVLGAFTCVTHFDLTTLAVPVKGAVWGLISAVCFAFYTVSPRKLMQKYHVTVDDAVIEEVLRTGTADIDGQYLDAIIEAAKEYTEGILRRLREHEYNPAMMRLYIVGGGGCLLKNFANLDADRVTINEDICATAKGYEYMANARMRKAG